MAEASIPVDLFNPGQVFACLGLMEASLILCGPTQAGFDWSAEETLFHLYASGNASPVREVLRFLGAAHVRALVQHRSANSARRWIGERRLLPDSPYPFPDPTSPATLPAELTDGRHAIVIDHWGDGTRRDNVKFWAGMAGYPGAKLAEDALALIADHDEIGLRPFDFSALQSSTFRFDWRHDYIPLEVGFSLNQHNHIEPRGYPLVELLAAIGLAHARPARVDPRDKLRYRYGVVGRGGAGAPDAPIGLPPALLRAALGATFTEPFPCRYFTMHLGWPGQEGQARCITSVTED